MNPYWTAVREFGATFCTQYLRSFPYFTPHSQECLITGLAQSLALRLILYLAPNTALDLALSLTSSTAPSLNPMMFGAKYVPEFGVN